MARFYGKIGFGETAETDPGVYEDVIHERQYFGDVIRDARRLGGGDKVNSDITVSNKISVVADSYANEHIYAIRYIEWMGTLWSVNEAEVERPRLILSLGGKYDGPTA